MQYYCVGYSTYPTDGNDSKGSSGAGLMPYCEGLEVGLVLYGWRNADTSDLHVVQLGPGCGCCFGCRSVLVWVAVCCCRWGGLTVILCLLWVGLCDCDPVLRMLWKVVGGIKQAPPVGFKTLLSRVCGNAHTGQEASWQPTPSSSHVDIHK